MEVLIRETSSGVAQAAADIICEHLNPGKVLGLATGSTPLETYQELIRRYQAGEISFRGMQAFCLDEYIGLPGDHEQSYHYVIRNEFTRHVDFNDVDVHSPNGMSEKPWEAADEYENAIIDAGGIDLQLLGVGRNGHIGFNEPATSLASTTRVEILHQQTVRDNARFFDSEKEVPKYAITQGLGTILRSGQALLIATGAGKAQAVHDLVEGPVSAACPASVLQLHPNAVVIVDESAASQLTEVEYYRHMEAMRPEWKGLDGLPKR
ncbi:glucosamine-6-phosphate deaminase [Corynebacterium sp. S7]